MLGYEDKVNNLEKFKNNIYKYRKLEIIIAMIRIRPVAASGEKNKHSPSPFGRVGTINVEIVSPPKKKRIAHYDQSMTGEIFLEKNNILNYQ